MKEPLNKSAALAADRLEISQRHSLAVYLAAPDVHIDQLRIDNWTEAPGSNTTYTGGVSSPYLS